MIEIHKLGAKRFRSTLTMHKGMPVFAGLVALVDILFLGLWFCVQAGNSTRLSGIHVELPKVKAQGLAEIRQYVVSIVPGSAGSWNLVYENRKITLREFQMELAKFQSAKPPTIAILADRRAPYELVAQVLAAIGNAGISGFLPVIEPAVEQQKNIEQ